VVLGGAKGGEGDRDLAEEGVVEVRVWLGGGGGWVYRGFHKVEGLGGNREGRGVWGAEGKVQGGEGGQRGWGLPLREEKGLWFSCRIDRKGF